MEFDKIYLKKDSPSEFRVEGDNTKTLESVVMDVYLDEKVAWGRFESGYDLYYIRPLEGDIHVLIQIDRSKFKPDIVLPLPGGAPDHGEAR